MRNQKKKSKSWMKVPSGQTVIPMNFSGLLETAAVPHNPPLNLDTQKRSDQVENKNSFLDTVRDLEYRIMKFGNVDNMERHKRKKTHLNFYDTSDPFLDDNPSAEKFKNQVVIPCFQDFFAFNGSLKDFIKSDLINQKIIDHECDQGIQNKPTKKSNPPKLEVRRASKRIRTIKED